MRRNRSACFSIRRAPGFQQFLAELADDVTGSERFTSRVEWVTSKNAPLGEPVPVDAVLALPWLHHAVLRCNELDATLWQPLQHGDVTTCLTCCFALTARCGHWRARLLFPYGAVITLSGE